MKLGFGLLGILAFVSNSQQINTVSISGLKPDSPGPKIVAGNKDNKLYSQQLFYSARAGGLSCLVKDQISIL